MSLSNLKYPLTKLRKKQLQKILKYGREILNLEVLFCDPEEMGTDSGGYIEPDVNEKGKITIENDHRGLILILILLHEFGHHIDFLKRGHKEEEEEAYGYYPDKKEDAPCPPKQNKVITFIEEKAIEYSQELAIYLDLKLPRFAVLKDKYYNRLSLKECLEKGFTTSKSRAKIRSQSAKLAKRELKNENK